MPGEAKSIGVLLDNADDTQLAAVRSYFQHKGISSDQLEFLLFYRKSPWNFLLACIITRKKSNWAGFAFNEDIASFLSHTYGKLYYLFADFDIHQQLILKHCKAAFKQAFTPKGFEPWLDLTIDDHPGIVWQKLNSLIIG